MDQFQEAVRVTKSRIAQLEKELRREREFLGRLIPNIDQQPQRYSVSRDWVPVLIAIGEKPLRYEHVIDFIEERGLALRRGAAKVGLNYRLQKGHLRRDAEEFFHLTAAGREHLNAALASQPV